MSLEVDRSRVRVLITDDEDSIRGMLITALTDAGWAVEGAKNGKEALEKLRAQAFHIIVSDINMPEMTGIELLEAVRREFPKTEFIVMTSHATLDTAVKAVSLGAYDYLHKPFEDISLVARKLEKVAERILLRQQNQELLKRLRTATHDLKNLLEVVSPLNGVIETQDLRQNAVKGLAQLYNDPTLKAAWWVKNEEGVWECQAAHPSVEEFKSFSSPEEARDGMPQLRKPLLRMLGTKGSSSEETLLFENLQEAATKIYLQQIDMCFEKTTAYAEILSLANRDGLTRLYNHRYFQERIRQEIAQAQRQKSGLSLLLFDVDHFKNYNDQNGHPAGDSLLKTLAELLSRSSGEDRAGKRITDVLARYGGEEFVMILPFTLHDGAKVKAERICSSIAEYDFPHRDKQPLGKVTASIGVASFPENGTTAEDLIAAADRALYAAKRGGRNRVASANVISSADELSTLPIASETSHEAPSESHSESPSELSAEPAPIPKTLGSLLEEDVVAEDLATKMERLTTESQQELEAAQKKFEEFKEPSLAAPPDFDLKGLMGAINDAVELGKKKIIDQKSGGEKS